MRNRMSWILTSTAMAAVLLAPGIAQAQTTTTGTGESNTYQLAFIGIAFQIFGIFTDFLLLLFQQFMTGFFKLFIPTTTT